MLKRILPALLLAGALLLSGCRAREALYISDPAWEAVFPAESHDLARGLADAGLRVRKLALPMQDARAELYEAVQATKAGYIVLSPLLGLEASSLSSAFPGKVFAVPGRPPAGSVLGSVSERGSALRAMGLAAALYLARVDAESGTGQGIIEIPGQAHSVAPARPGALAIFQAGADSDALSFKEGFLSGADQAGLDASRLILISIADDRTEAEARARDLLSREIAFAFIAAGGLSKHFVNALPIRGCLAAGLGLRALASSRKGSGEAGPALAASLEEDFRALAEAALESRDPAGPPPSPRLVLVVLDPALARLIPYSPPDTTEGGKK
jgi:hypothetical protein